MFCPSCGAEVAAAKFCENCGSPLPEIQETTPIEQPTEPAYPGVQPTAQMPQSTQPAASPYAAEVPGDSAWEAQPQQAYQTGQTTQMPPQGYAASSAGPQSPYQQAAPYHTPPSGGQAPNAAFVLVIVGLVLSVLFVTFVPGIVCSIIGLVLNAGYNKKGLYNPRKTSTMVIGIIGIVIALMCLIFTVAVGVMTAQVLEEADRQGVNIVTDDIDVTTDSDGHINISLKDSKGSSAVSGTITTHSSSAASAAATTGKYDDAKYHDSNQNPTVYSMIELTGSEMNDMLEAYDYEWDNASAGWLGPNDALYAVTGTSGDYTKSQLESLPKGAAGQPVILGLFAEGYATPGAAFAALSSGVAVEDRYDVDDASFAVVKNSASVKYLAVVTGVGADEQLVILFTDESLSSGLFKSIVGVDVGASVDEAWMTIKDNRAIGDAVTG